MRDYLKEILEHENPIIEEAMWEVCESYEDYGRVLVQLANYYAGTGGFDEAMSWFLQNWVTEYATDIANER